MTTWTPVRQDVIEVLRATAHVQPAADLPPAGRFKQGVTDLDAARVLRALENGTEVLQGGRHVWFAAPAMPRPFTAPMLALVVQELIRTGLAFGISEELNRSTWRVRVIPALIHVRRPGTQRPACSARRPRYRLVENTQAASCPDCFTALLLKTP